MNGAGSPYFLGNVVFDLPYMSVFARVFLLSAITLIAPLTLQAQREVAETMHHVHVSYSVREGLPQSSVYAIVRDAAGYLWVGTEYGLGYFDGTRWRECTGWPPIGTVWDLASDPEGALWIASSTMGLLWLNPVPGIPDSLWERAAYAVPGDVGVESIERDPRGFLWVGTEQGLFRFAGGQWSPVLPEMLGDFTIYDIQVVGDRVLLATDGGAYVLTENGLSMWDTPDAVFAIFEDSEGRLWAGTNTEVLQLYEDGTYTVSPGPIGRVSAFAESPEHEIWVGTYRGAWKYTRGRWHTVPEIRDFRYYPVLSLMGDGDMFVGTINAGLVVLRETGWHHLREINGKVLRAVMAIAEDASGAFWLGASGNVFRFDRGQWRRLNIQPESFVSTIYTGDGNVWVGGENGVWRYDGRSWRRFALEHEDAHVWLNRIVAGADGELWAGTPEGLWRWDGRRWKLYRTGDARIDTQYITALVRTSDGSLLVGTHGKGLLRFSVENRRVESLLPSLAGPYQEVIAVHRCRTTSHLMVSTQGGLLLWDGRQWYTPEEYGKILPVMHNLVYSIEEDDSLYHYLGTRHGIFRVDNRLTEHFRDGTPVHVEHFLEEDGLSAGEANAGATLYDRRGRLWFGTINGISLFDPSEHVYPFSLPPRVVISYLEGPPPDEVYAFLRAYRRYLITGAGPPTLSLIRPHRTLDLQLGLLTSHGLTGVMYRVSLEGYESGNVSWTPEATFSYRQLPPGTYRLVARGRDREGRESAPLVLNVVVPPAFWERVDVQVLFFFFTVGLLAVVLQAGLHASERRKQQEKELEHARAVAEWHAFHTRILESVPGFVCVVDTFGEVIQANPRAARWLERLHIGRFDELLVRVAPSEREVLQEAFAKVQRGEEAHQEVEVTVREENKERRLMLHLTPISLSEEQLGVVISGEDVTQIRQLEAFRESFYRMLVHDLRSPLSAALMVVREIVGTKDMPREVVQELLQPLLPTLEQGLSIVQNLMDIGKLEAGRFETFPEELHPDEYLQEQIACVMVLAQQAGVQVASDVQSTESFYADRVLLSRTLNNLLTNAIKFTPRGGRVILRYRVQGGEVILEVQDTGKGLPEEKIGQLFEQFISLDRKAGTGLGLAFSRLAVEAMGGRIEATNVPEGGGLFRVILPRHPETNKTA